MRGGIGLLRHRNDKPVALIVVLRRREEPVAPSGLDRLFRVLQFGSLGVVIAYGYGWTLLSETLRPLKVSPEEINVGPDWILVRTPIYLTPIAVSLILAAILLWSGSHVSQRLLRILITLSIGAVVLALCASETIHVTSTDDGPVAYKVARVGSHYALGLLVFAYAVWRRQRRRTASVAVVALLLFALVATVTADLAYYREAGLEIRQVRKAGVHNPYFIPIMITPLVAVTVNGASTGDDEVLATCALYLGSANGVTVVVEQKTAGDLGRVLRLPTDRVMMEEVAPSTCPAVRTNDGIAWE
jgi:hypothetical protein